MTSVLIRIALRYGAAYLVARGLLTDDAGAMLAGDPDVEMAIGVAVGAVAEVWWLLARRMGWER